MSLNMRRKLLQLNDTEKELHYKKIMTFYQYDGGFSGRRGESDLYYTTFGIRCLHALNKIDDNIKLNTKSYLDKTELTDPIDILSYVLISSMIDNREIDKKRITDLIELYRKDDGGYGKTLNEEFGTIYITFIVATCYNLLGTRIPKTNNLKQFIMKHMMNDHGFSKTRFGKQSSTNVTAAGIGLYMLLNFDCKNILDIIKLPFKFNRVRNVKKFLLKMQDEESGGWLATKNAPFTDLASTYSALFTLDNVMSLSKPLTEMGLKFVETCKLNSGGYSAGPWESETDVEYTFYGLGSVAIGLKKGLMNN